MSHGPASTTTTTTTTTVVCHPPPPPMPVVNPNQMTVTAIEPGDELGITYPPSRSNNYQAQTVGPLEVTFSVNAAEGDEGAVDFRATEAHLNGDFHGSEPIEAFEGIGVPKYQDWKPEVSLRTVCNANSLMRHLKA